MTIQIFFLYKVQVMPFVALSIAWNLIKSRNYYMVGKVFMKTIWATIELMNWDSVTTNILSKYSMNKFCRHPTFCNRSSKLYEFVTFLIFRFLRKISTSLQFLFVCTFSQHRLNFVSMASYSWLANKSSIHLVTFLQLSIPSQSYNLYSKLDGFLLWLEQYLRVLSVCFWSTFIICLLVHDRMISPNLFIATLNTLNERSGFTHS